MPPARPEGKRSAPRCSSSGAAIPTRIFLYAEELKRFEAEGIADLRVAFSRKDAQKTYVQDLLRAEGERVWQMIEAGAIVYVCGDGGRMEPDVKRALVALYGAKTGRDAAASAAWIADLGRTNRYVLDVWSGG